MVEENMVGNPLGSFRVIEQIGRGGMAVVYKAYDPALDRYVAIKVLPRYFSHDPEFAHRFEREAKAIARLNHPNILPVYSFGHEGDLSYIVMRYVDAGTLKELLGKPLDLRTTVEIFGQVGRALDYAHQHGVIHRDVKPSNVLMDEGKWALLTDFGLARIAENVSQITKTGVGVGTPAYMSPEQGQGLPVDKRTDIYSLGVTLYEMVTGRVPFDAETPMAIVIKHISAPLPLPRTLNPNIPEEVERVVLKALAKVPGDRYQTAVEMVEALEKAVSGAPTLMSEALVKDTQQVNLPLAETLVQPATLELPAAERLGESQPRKKLHLPVWAWGVVGGIVLIFLSVGFIAFFQRSVHITKPTPLPVAQEATSLPATATASPTTSITPQPTDTAAPPPTEIPGPTALPPAIVQKGAEMVLIPAGSFQMGCDINNSAESCQDYERPLHILSLDAFYIDKYEVTNALYQVCVEAGGCAAQSDIRSYTRNSYYDNPKFTDYPVIIDNWEHARSYCAWRGARLPTEAEWEKAARGDREPRIYPWGNQNPDCTMANFSGCKGDTEKVGSYPNGASPYGVQDMAGNLWEWVNDWFDGSYYKKSSPNNPFGPETGLYKVLRGGGWHGKPSLLRTFIRNYDPDYFVYGNIGFRCADSPVISMISDDAPATESSSTMEYPSSFFQKGAEMVLVPAGSFQMGCDTEGCPDEEKPLHTVTLDAYYIDKYEVTNALYQACVDAGRCVPPSITNSSTRDSYYGNPEFADFPVMWVSWIQAQQYCEWRGARLPTEAEWEKAARGEQDKRLYPWGDQPPECTLVNYAECIGDTAKVGSHLEGASPFGVYDMAGNLWEWVNDWLDPIYYSRSPTSNPLGPDEGTIKVLRGGSWGFPIQDLRTTDRGYNTPDFNNNVIGFRCAASPGLSFIFEESRATEPPAVITQQGAEMVLIPAGAFQMGCHPDCQRIVTLDAFYIDKYEVTNGLYQICVEAGGCSPPSKASTSTRSSYYGSPEFADFPVVYVSWDQARQYCEWRSARLPTEAEWEKAARGDKVIRTYPWGNKQPNCTLANFGGCQNDTLRVGSFPDGASPYGVLDLAGNVWELLNDWFSNNYNDTSSLVNPLGPENGTERVIKGGGWHKNDIYVEVSNREPWGPTSVGDDIGFRCVADP